MKHKIQKLLRIADIVIGIPAALYIGLSVYYMGRFSYGTWINGIYCTGKSVWTVNTELLAQPEYETLTLLLPGGERENVRMEDIGLEQSYEKPLLALFAEQNPWKWYENVRAPASRREIIPERSFDEKRFEQVFSDLSFVKERKTDDAYRVFIRKTANGYELVNERERVLDPEKCRETIKEAMLRGDQVCDLAAEGCYHDLPLDEEMQSVIDLWRRIDAFQTCGVRYRFGKEEVRLTPDIVCDWLVAQNDTSSDEDVLTTGENPFLVDENGEFTVDREKLEAFVDSLADRYDTVGAERAFHATRGDTVTITGGTYGNRIDRKAEKEYLYQAFCERRTEVRDPVYLQEARQKGRDDIGDTYIEIDMGEQHLYYYEDGKCVLDTPVVTGDMLRRRDTPPMVCYVYAKQRNRTLRGPGYASFVKYWMPVKGGIGIHDARWRDEFGGEIYKTKGSHGCINTPEEAMAQLYERVEIGTPVVMFY
ncbi:MAG: L,D-transpeptidase/peptidoglycan binding protein [Lachnospiraceae bacterium]|nr:L,D-transpeptidase/peptidoglycan binding protein [Lachnospiraceae bacterium]